MPPGLSWKSILTNTLLKHELRYFKDAYVVDVAHVGIAPVVAGGAVSLGAAVTADASGRAAAAAGGGKRAAGIALDAASGAGDVIRILLAPHLA